MDINELQALIENRWDASAGRYGETIRGELASPLKNAWLKKIMDNAPDKRTLDVLDIGTGPGFLAIVLGEVGHNITAVDCSKHMIEEAEQNARNAGVAASFYKMDSHTLLFQDNSFDLIISRNVTWSLYDPVKAYMEWKRVLRPGGRMIVFDANWGLQNFDDEIRRKNEENAEKYRKMFNKQPHPTKWFYEEMYLSDKVRPDWDMTVIREIGISPCCERNVNSQLWPLDYQVQFEATPMFMIVGEKPLEREGISSKIL